MRTAARSVSSRNIAGPESLGRSMWLSQRHHMFVCARCVVHQLAYSMTTFTLLRRTCIELDLERYSGNRRVHVRNLEATK